MDIPSGTKYIIDTFCTMYFIEAKTLLKQHDTFTLCTLTELSLEELLKNSLSLKTIPETQRVLPALAAD